MSKSKRIFYFDATRFTLPRITKQDAFKNPAIETFLSVTAINEKEARNIMEETFQPSKIAITPISQISKHDLFSPHLIFGKKYCFELTEKMPETKPNYIVKPAFWEKNNKKLVSFWLTAKHIVLLYTQLIWYDLTKEQTQDAFFEVKNCELR